MLYLGKVYCARAKRAAAAVIVVRKRSTHCIVGQFRDDPNQRLVDSRYCTAKPCFASLAVCNYNRCAAANDDAEADRASNRLTRLSSVRLLSLSPFLTEMAINGMGQTHIQVGTKSCLKGSVTFSKSIWEEATLNLTFPNLATMFLPRAERLGEEKGRASVSSVTYGETRSACLISNPDQMYFI